jgi:hypothetical protein
MERNHQAPQEREENSRCKRWPNYPQVLLAQTSMCCRLRNGPETRLSSFDATSQYLRKLKGIRCDRYMPSTRSLANRYRRSNSLQHSARGRRNRCYCRGRCHHRHTDCKKSSLWMNNCPRIRTGLTLTLTPSTLALLDNLTACQADISGRHTGKVRTTNYPMYPNKHRFRLSST